MFIKEFGINRIKVFIFVGIISLVSAIACPSNGNGSSELRPRERKLTEKELTVLGIVVGKSTLAEVNSRFKSQSPIYHQGDAAESVYLLCFSGDNGTILTFESNGEMGGDQHIVTSVAVFGSKMHYRFEGQCTKNGEASKATLGITGIRLGMGISRIKKLLGKPTKESEMEVLYKFHTLEKKRLGNADISTTLKFGLMSDKVTQFSLTKIESY